MIAALLAVFAVIDAGFAGFRAAAGRSGLIHKRRHYGRAIVEGVVAGVAAVLLLGALTAVLLVASPSPAGLYGELVAIGLRLAPIFATYGAAVLMALAMYAAGRHEVRTLATVSILGPLTLLRPYVVAAATAWAVWPCDKRVATALTLLASTTVLSVGAILERCRAQTPAESRRECPREERRKRA